MTIGIDTDSPITDGDLSCAIVYRLTDTDGSLWRSAPGFYLAAIRADGSQTEGGPVHASGQWIRVPQLRHLLEGTTAQIEIYFGDTDLQLFRVLDNDPTVPYVDICPQQYYLTDNGSVMPTLTYAITRAGIGETLYTLGGRLENDPPPQMTAVEIWNNRAIGVFGNEIWPSQEFSTGNGIQWADILKLRWDEGTGPIRAIGKINADYCAVFKENAIGIISGAGPDGLGNGNYIVRTLSTESGVTNPLSILSSNDGCYFQDSKSTNLMVVSSSLTVEECTKGWKTPTGTTITATLHYENSREAWFATSDKELVILDYGHRTESSKYGQVYTWDLTAFGQQIVGMEIASGAPVLMFRDGSIATYSDSQVKDIKTGAVDSAILMKTKSGALMPFSVGGTGDISEIQMIGDRLSNHILKMTVYPDGATSGTTKQVAITSGSEDVGMKPPNCQRIGYLEVELEEALASPVVYGKGFNFVGFSMMVQPRGRARVLNYGRMI